MFHIEYTMKMQELAKIHALSRLLLSDLAAKHAVFTLS